MNPDTPRSPRSADRPLTLVVGIAAVVAPAIHSMTDILEWYQGGFSVTQLWLNYAAFLPMPWLLLGLYAVHEKRPGVIGLIGSLLYGVAFTYFVFTTLYALAEQIPDYETLWGRLGAIYTLHGLFMVAGGLMFGWSAMRAAWLPRLAVQLFLAGLIINAIVALIPVPDILQIVGSAFRNAGLLWMGCGILSQGRRIEPGWAE